MTPAFDALRGDLLELADYVQTLESVDPPAPHAWALSRHVERFLASLEALEQETRGDGGHAPHGDTQAGSPVNSSAAGLAVCSGGDSRHEKPDSLASE